jgi:hypothetical protein
MIANDSPATAGRARSRDARGAEKHDADGSEVATHDSILQGSASICLEVNAMDNDVGLDPG